MQPTRHLSRLLLAALLAIVAVASPAVWAARLTDAQRAEIAQIRAFTLTDRFVDKYLAAQADPDYPVAALAGMLVGTDDDEDDTEYDTDADGGDEYDTDEGNADEDDDAQPQSTAQWIDAIEATPGAADFLAGHGLSVRDFVLGRSMLAFAAFLQAEQQNPDLFEDDEVGGIDLDLIVSPANMAVYLRNKDKIHRTMMEAGRRQLRSHEKSRWSR
ncbi:MAG: hypothetical protein CVV16_07385 [Gammaproteobacteria bacterium HGW-Gammaproteobacteria-6]|jgi:hypothetical protein|nr:MAG: hypothetical protein CVV16_07385 [Gammaproteobacteria bacterium HGW-Gammaproteobacteria-6]PKM16672.1 MAG: hypothetical protein CVV12_01900 [Gammaproteobacteria bacterium HGW-Gammaproteobacteria-2]